MIINYQHPMPELPTGKSLNNINYKFTLLITNQKSNVLFPKVPLLHLPGGLLSQST